MPLFLSRDQLYRLLQRELPEGVYPDGPASAYYSTADMSAIAGLLETAYTNLSDIYDNYFPQFAVDKLADWEVKVFGAPSNSLKSVAERQQEVLDHIRAENSISYDSIFAQLVNIFARADLIEEDNTVVTPDWLLDFNELEVDTYLGFRDPLVPHVSLTFALVTWNGCQGGGAWILEESELDSDTYLSAMDPNRAHGLDCSLNYVAAGITQAQLTEIQETAYTYEVRITGTAEQIFLDYLDQQLTLIEPARSTHVIYNNFPGPVSP